jgi:hypothetical protein
VSCAKRAGLGELRRHLAVGGVLGHHPFEDRDLALVELNSFARGARSAG